MLDWTQSVLLERLLKAVIDMANITAGHVTSALAGLTLASFALIGSGHVAGQADLKEVEVMAIDTRSQVHKLQTEQAVMGNDIDYIKKASDEQNVKLNKIIETLGEMQKPKKRRRR